LTVLCALALIPALALGWLIGGHGIHFLGLNTSWRYLAHLPVSFLFVMLVPLLLFTIASSNTDLTENCLLVFAVTVFLTILAALVSLVVHALAPGVAAHGLGIEHGASIVRDWMIWRY